MARPSLYNEEISNALLDHIATGKSLVSWCKNNLIDYSTVTGWLRTNAEFSLRYARAREDQADYLADELMEISDAAERDAQIIDGKAVIDGFSVQRAKLMIDTRKWAAAKLKPKVYGDSTQIKHADADGGKLDLKTILGGISGDTSGLPRTDEIPE